MHVMSPLIIRNKCAACFRQYNRMEHLVEHMKVSYHSVHEPKCGVCGKHCRSFESLREHLIGMQKLSSCREEKTAAYIQPNKHGFNSDDASSSSSPSSFRAVAQGGVRAGLQRPRLQHLPQHFRQQRHRQIPPCGLPVLSCCSGNDIDLLVSTLFIIHMPYTQFTSELIRCIGFAFVCGFGLWLIL